MIVELHKMVPYKLKMTIFESVEIDELVELGGEEVGVVAVVLPVPTLGQDAGAPPKVRSNCTSLVKSGVNA
jgi:hypothetical protein